MFSFLEVKYYKGFRADEKERVGKQSKSTKHIKAANMKKYNICTRR